jgi:divalent metal cation (Fe/Co/Zn/Cd) transporter
MSASPSILQRITHIVYNHRPDVITKIDSVEAIRFGMNYFTDVNIGLSSAMPLAMAHDIGIELQDQLETMEDIERAYVNLGFDFAHLPTFEHKRI